MLSISTGIITTIAGTGTAGYSGDGGAATSAILNSPRGMVVDNSKNVYFADAGNYCIREVTASTGIITTVAGTCGSYGYNGDGIAATSAQLGYFVGDIAVDSAGNLYIADYASNRIREVTASTGIITTVAGNGTGGYSGDGGPATSAELSRPQGVALDSSGNIYIADALNAVIRKVAAGTGIITTVDGNGTVACTTGVATASEEGMAPAVRVDSSGNIYIGDNNCNVVWEVTASTGNVAIFAGQSCYAYYGDGLPASSHGVCFEYPIGLGLDNSSNLYIADMNNNRIREVKASTGIINTVVGNGTQGYSGDGGPATSAEINTPVGGVAAYPPLFMATPYSAR
jgi:sugar lactone lactonase YvrE